MASVWHFPQRACGSGTRGLLPPIKHHAPSSSTPRTTPTSNHTRQISFVHAVSVQPDPSLWNSSSFIVPPPSQPSLRYALSARADLNETHIWAPHGPPPSPPPPFPSHIIINKWLLPFLLPYHNQLLTSHQFCATTRMTVGSWCFKRPISVATTTERRSSWLCRMICIPGGASPRTLAACCSLTFAWRVIRSLLRLLLGTATSGPCRRARLPCCSRLVFELHFVVAPTTNQLFSACTTVGATTPPLDRKSVV